MHHIDPDFLLETQGVLAHFVLNPRAEIDGLLFADGTEVHTAPHLSTQLAELLRPGMPVSVRGIKPRGANVIVAVAIDAGQGRRILDDGSRERPAEPSGKPHAGHTEHGGKIEALLHGPKGNVHGFLLADGVIVRFPPHGVAPSGDLLAVGASVIVRGESLRTGHGRLIEAAAIGRDAATLTAISRHPEHAPKKPKKSAGPEQIRNAAEIDR